MTETDQLLKIRDVIRIANVGKTSIYRLMAERSFPRPVRVSPKVVRWKAREVQDWMDRLERAEAQGALR
jgi:prophage regulatory protein